VLYLSRLAALFGCLLLGAGCSSADGPPQRPADVLTDNDFEDLIGWNRADQLASLSRDVAHSGRYALKVDAGHEFSLTFDARLGDLITRPPRALRVEAWVRVPGPGAEDAQLVTNLGLADAPPLTEDRVRLGEIIVGANEWTHVVRELQLPPTARPDHRVRIYLWRGNTQVPAYLDDLRLTAVY
jgi:hypothetical protein